MTTTKIIILLVCILVVSLQQQCAQSQYFNGQRCAPCKANCHCSSENGCTSCLSGYTYDSKYQNCLQCPTATSAVNVGCAQCCYQIVATTFVCSSCPALSNTYLLGGQCVRIEGCTSITSNGLCRSCSTGFFLKDGKCIACHASCTTCTDSTFCTNCMTAYYNATNANLGVCAACPVGCSTCTSNTACSACLSRYRLSGSTCAACGSNCLACTNTACTTCQTGYGVVAGVCYACTTVAYSGTAGCLVCTSASSTFTCTKCSNGFYLSDTGTCVSCNTRFPNSILCTSTKPLQCLNDFIPTIASRYYLYGNQCVANTRSCKTMSSSSGYCSSCYFESGAYYRLSGGTCIQCAQSGCATYGSTCDCLSCQNGYQYVNKQCVACQNLNCFVCQANVRSCEVCAPYYGLISSACIQCTQNTCLNCDGDSTKCIKCLTGYYVSSGTCYRCQASCQSCTSSTLCQKCNAGHYLQSSGRCKSLPSNCVEVDSSGSCSKCNYGYFISSGMCVPCSTDLLNLESCNKFCPSYYALLKFDKIFSIFTLGCVVLYLLLLN